MFPIDKKIICALNIKDIPVSTTIATVTGHFRQASGLCSDVLIRSRRKNRQKHEFGFKTRTVKDIAVNTDQPDLQKLMKKSQ